jgi:hypothetical protein
MKKVLTFLITFAIRLLFGLREVLLRHGWMDVQTPHDLFIHLQAARAQLADDKIRKRVLKAHDAHQQLVLISMDDAVAQEYRSAGFTVTLQEPGKYTIKW